MLVNRYKLDSKELEKEVRDFVDMEEDQELIDLLFLDYSREINWEIKNKLNLYNLKWLSNEEIEKIVNILLINKTKEIGFDDEYWYRNININDEEWIVYLNYLFSRALEFYSEKLKWKIPKKYQNKNNFFENKDDVINFLKNTTKWIKSSQFSCEIAKICYWINEIIDTPELLELEKKASYLLKTKLFRAAQMDNPEQEDLSIPSTWKLIVNNKIINFKMRMRWKDEDSWIIKILRWGKEYLTGKSINDGIWIEFEVENEEDAILLLWYFYETFFHKIDDDWEIANTVKSFKDKWVAQNISVDNLEKNWSINQNFAEMLKTSNFKAKNSQNEDYKDVKFIWSLDLPKNINDERSQKTPHSVELRAIIVWNKNEEWLSDHRILDTLKIILVRTKLKWYVTSWYIKYLVNELLEENNDLHNKFKKEEIYNYYMSKLIKVERKWKIDIFTEK